VYQTRVWEIPQGTRVSKGKALINIINISPEEKITSVLSYSNELLLSTLKEKDNEKSSFVFMCTKHGTVKKTPLSDFEHIRQNGIIALKLDGQDELLWASVTNGKNTVVLASKLGKAIVFDEKDIRPTGRNSIGVRGMRLDIKDEITSMDIFDAESKKKKLMVITEKGIGKKTLVSLFREQNRGGKGVKIANIDERTGSIAFSQVVQDESKTLLITSKKGQVVKIPLTTIPNLSRNAKGVILMRFSDKSDRVVSATFI
jgi:DNA gyrase subunit A